MKIALDIDINEYNRLKQELDEALTKYSLTYSDFKLVSDAISYLYVEKYNIKISNKKCKDKKILNDLYEYESLIKLLMGKCDELDEQLDILKSEIDNKENEINIFARNTFIDMETKNSNSLMKIKSV